jgi:(p)ppGpp synthase/HD superfamily hydrolase
MSHPQKQLAHAISIVAKAFKDRLDKGGQPYILHCLFVMYKQTTITRKIIAILHDLVEDTDWDFDDLRAKGFGDSILVPLRLLTHDPTVKTYEEYIAEISTNEDARAVKLADLEHNSQITRLKGLTKADFAKMEQYHKAYVYLSKV